MVFLDGSGIGVEDGQSVGQRQILEDERSQGSSQHGGEPVDPNSQQGFAFTNEALCDLEASSYSRVEGATRDTADRGSTSEDDHTDAETIEEVGTLARVRDVEDDEGESEGEDELREEGLSHEFAGGATRVRISDILVTLKEHGDKTSTEGATALAENVASELQTLILLGEPDGEGDGGVEVATRDITEGEDHSHEHESDGDEIDVGLGVAGDNGVVHVNECNSENEQEGTEGLSEVVSQERVESDEIRNTDVLVDDVE